MKEKRINEIKGIILLAAGLIVLVSLVSFSRYDLGFDTSHPNPYTKNLIGKFGAYLAWIIIYLFGRWPSFIIPVFIIWLGIKLFKHEPPYLRPARIIGLILLLLSSSSLIALVTLKNKTVSFYYAGSLGFIICENFNKYAGEMGCYIVFIMLILVALMLVAEILISTLLLKVINKTKGVLISIFKRKKGQPLAEAIMLKKRESLESGLKSKIVTDGIPEEEEPGKPASLVKPKVKIKTNTSAASEPKIKPRLVKIGDYHLPPLDLLDSPPPLEARQIKEDLTNNARILEETLDDFGITVKVTDIERGPIITRYEL